jgi:hypothetical protein
VKAFSPSETYLSYQIRFSFRGNDDDDDADAAADDDDDY